MTLKMMPEFEIKVLNIDVRLIKIRLEQLGAKYRGSFLQQRYIYDFKPPQPKKRIRLRSD